MVCIVVAESAVLGAVHAACIQWVQVETRGRVAESAQSRITTEQAASWAWRTSAVISMKITTINTG